MYILLCMPVFISPGQISWNGIAESCLIFGGTARLFPKFFIPTGNMEGFRFLSILHNTYSGIFLRAILLDEELFLHVLKGCGGKKIVDDVTLTDLVLALTGQSSLDLNELSGQSLKIYHWALFRSRLLREFPGWSSG